MKTRATLSAALMILAATSAATAADLTLEVQYIGSTTGDTRAGLVIEDLTQSQFQAPEWHHYFSVVANFTPATPDEVFRFATINLNLAGVTAVTRTGSTDPNANKWTPAGDVDAATGLSRFGINGDGGQNGDLQAIFISQTSYDASRNFTGPAALGSFAVQFNAPLAEGQKISLSAAGARGLSFSYFTDGGQFQTVTGGINAGTWSLRAPGELSPGTPESPLDPNAPAIIVKPPAPPVTETTTPTTPPAPTAPPAPQEPTPESPAPTTEPPAPADTPPVIILPTDPVAPAPGDLTIGPISPWQTPLLLLQDPPTASDGELEDVALTPDTGLEPQPTLPTDPAPIVIWTLPAPTNSTQAFMAAFAGSTLANDTSPDLTFIPEPATLSLAALSAALLLPRRTRKTNLTT